MAGDQPPNPVRSVRALAKSLTAPLTGLEQLLQEADTLLVALTPPLAHLVEFAPFAQLTVSEPAVQPAATSPTARRSGAISPRPSTMVTAASPPESSTVAPASGQTAPSGRDSVAPGQSAPPIFSLSDRKRTAAAPLNNAHLPPSGVDRPVLAAIPVPDQPDWVTTPGAYPAQTQLIADAPHTQTAVGAPSFESGVLPATGSAPSGMVEAAAPLATMPLLATLTSALLATPPPMTVASLATAPAAVFVASRQTPTVSVDNFSVGADFAQTDGGTSAPHTAMPRDTLPTLSPPSIPASLPAAGLQTDQAGEPFAGWSVATAPVTPPDAWTLAQLINEVLSAEARRHGVDLS